MADNCEVAVIGGGAAGLYAVATLGERLHDGVVILERQPRVGKKLLATGNGRCNVTNMRIPSDAATAYHASQTALDIIKRCPPYMIRAGLERMGLLTYEEGEGRVYPLCEQAGAVLDCLRFRAEETGVRELCDFDATGIKRSGDGWRVTGVDGREVRARRVIVACGGMAAPNLGGGNGGYQLMQSLGHTRTTLYPALTPLKCDAALIRGLKGVRVKAKLTLERGRRELGRETGEVLFTEYGVSGIAVMQLSRLMAGETGCTLTLDMLPDMEPGFVETIVKRRATLSPGRTLEQLMCGILHKRIGLCVLRACNLSPADAASTLNDDSIRAIARAFKDYRLPITAAMPFANAQVTRGGLPLDEFTPTLESKLAPGVYAAGELLDVDGPCGGYNLHWAWASALTCATDIMESK